MGTKLYIRKGEIVRVIAGESKGSEGKILSIDAKKYKAVVEGINMVSKHTKPNAQYTDGGIIKKEAPIHISNLMVIDPKSGEPTRIGRRKDKKGKSQRYAKKSGEILK